MKKRMIGFPVLILAGACLVALAPQPARGVDTEWATAGKILTGLVAGQILVHHICNAGGDACGEPTHGDFRDGSENHDR